MNAALWMLRYHIDESDRATYVDWFHTVHIPEKLARSGYNWANHYGAPMVSTNGTREYIAMFGGTQTRTFLDPSPAQLKPRQDALTRDMMQLRQHASGAIFSHEWSAGTGDPSSLSPIHAEHLRVHWLATESADEAVGAYAVQTMSPHLLANGRATRVSKLVAVTASVRHVVLEQCAPGDGAPGQLSDLPDGVTTSTFAGERLWPAAL